MGFSKTSSAIALAASFVFSSNILADNILTEDKGRKPDFVCTSQTLNPDLKISEFALTTSVSDSPIVTVMKPTYIFASLQDYFLTHLPNTPVFYDFKNGINPGLGQQILDGFEQDTGINLNSEITSQECPEILKYFYGQLNPSPNISAALYPNIHMQCLSDSNKVSATTSCQLLETYNKESKVRQLPVKSATYAMANPSGEITGPETTLDTVSNAANPTLGFCLDELEEKINDILLRSLNPDSSRIIGYCYSENADQETVIIAEVDCEISDQKHLQGIAHTDISCGHHHKTPLGNTRYFEM